jgi:cell wall-associated NlpC family hydrolase
MGAMRTSLAAQAGRQTLALALGLLLLALSAGCSAPQRRTPLGPTRDESLGSGPGPAAETVIDFASAQVGKRYCWGGTGPACFDCSGLVQRAWGLAGVRLPRTADAIASELPEVPIDEVRAGDILWWPGHVGLYAGGGWVVEALDRRHGVVRRPATRPHRAFRPSG